MTGSKQYHERAIVFNERNMHRVFDVAYDGYCGGKDVQLLNWDDDGQKNQFIEAMEDTSKPFDGPSVIVLPMTEAMDWLPSPLVLMDDSAANNTPTLLTPESHAQQIKQFRDDVLKRISNNALKQELQQTIGKMYSELQMHGQGAYMKNAADATVGNEATHTRLAYQGTAKWVDRQGKEKHYQQGCGHHGADFIGAAAVRNGKALMPQANPVVNTTIMAKAP